MNRQKTKLTSKDWHARAEAFEEAASHLELAWTDNPVEFAQGKFVSAWARKEALYCAQKAGWREDQELRRSLRASRAI